MSTAQFLPLNTSGTQFGSTSVNDQKPETQQHFNLLLQAFLLMKAKNNNMESNNAQYLSGILNPILQGHHAIPIHLKILIDKIIEHLDVTDVQKALQDTHWSVEDLQRGYILIVSRI
jgi:hypothetical protein